MKFRILVTDEIDPEGVALLESEPDFIVHEVPTPSPETLLEMIGEYDAIVGRSATRISTEVLQQGKRLRVIGRAGVGVDNIALTAATALGVAVINAPAGNRVAVAELFFGSVISLLRHINDASLSMRDGRWDRSRLIGSELKGRTLGILGAGRIGGEVAARAHAFGMDVMSYDPYVPDTRMQMLRARRADTLEGLLQEADIVTIHTPLTPETRGLLGRRELMRMRKGAILVNLARGGIVDDDALIDLLETRHLAGAVLDVYAHEPVPADHALRRASNVLLMPHLGASTIEAQRNVAVEVCAAVREALLRGEFSRSINAALVEGPWSEDHEQLQGVMLLARRAAALARAVLSDQGVKAIQRLTVRCGPDLAGGREALLAAAALGCIEGVLAADRLNLINARTLAESSGIDLSLTESAQAPAGTVEIGLRGAMQELTVTGDNAGGSPRLTNIGGYRVNVNIGGSPAPTLIVLTNRDVPGVIGRVGMVLGDERINIAEYHQARLRQGGDALAAIVVDGEPGPGVRERLAQIPEILSISIAVFRND